uniref:Uncharacterized protein n=1 Tax=Steinernema glaseri TaxID=37863 RepID=A0A1I7YU07_9BILA
MSVFDQDSDSPGSTINVRINEDIRADRQPEDDGAGTARMPSGTSLRRKGKRQRRSPRENVAGLRKLNSQDVGDCGRTNSSRAAPSMASSASFFHVATHSRRLECNRKRRTCLESSPSSKSASQVLCATPSRMSMTSRGKQFMFGAEFQLLCLHVSSSGFCCATSFSSKE